MIRRTFYLAHAILEAVETAITPTNNSGGGDHLILEEDEDGSVWAICEHGMQKVGWTE